jgi:hypothetical protein
MVEQAREVRTEGYLELAFGRFSGEMESRVGWEEEFLDGKARRGGAQEICGDAGRRPAGRGRANLREAGKEGCNAALAGPWWRDRLAVDVGVRDTRGGLWRAAAEWRDALHAAVTARAGNGQTRC